MAAAHARPGVVLDDMRHIDREAFERSAVFNEALVFDDSVHALFGNFAVEGDLILAQAFLRGRGDGPFDAANADRMRALLPHLRRATRLRHLVRQMHELHDDVRLALDALPTAVAILDPNEDRDRQLVGRGPPEPWRRSLPARWQAHDADPFRG